MFAINNNIQPVKCGTGLTRKILGRGGKLMMVEVIFDKDSVGEVHSHPHEQISYIANGCFEFDLNGEKKLVKKGDSIYIPANLTHGAIAIEDKSIIVDIFTPQREELL